MLLPRVQGLLRSTHSAEMLHQVDEDSWRSFGDQSCGLAAGVIEIVGLLDILSRELVLLHLLETEQSAVEIQAPLRITHGYGV